MTTLEVYISDECWSCQETRRIVGVIAPRFPAVRIELRDLSDGRRPSSVFATPTYVLDGQTVYLGNPTEEELGRKLATALAAAMQPIAENR